MAIPSNRRKSATRQRSQFRLRPSDDRHAWTGDWCANRAGRMVCFLGGCLRALDHLFVAPIIDRGAYPTAAERTVRLAGIGNIPSCQAVADKVEFAHLATLWPAPQNLQRLIGGAEVQCRKSDTDRYGRTVARCSAGGRDLSCAQLEGGFTIRRYGYIFCF